jgi:uncharacterized UPF0160 family protein
MRIATHNGPFHADDVLACAVLLWAFPEAEVVRTRDPKVIATADIVFDVGAVFDPATGRYDHHQKPEEQSAPRPNGVPYSSFGLVWRQFGAQLVGEEVQTLVDESLVQGIDATDCGKWNLLPTETDDSVKVTSLSHVISGFNPLWNEAQDFDAAFMVAVGVATSVLKHECAFKASLAEAREVVHAGARRDDGRILLLERFCPWQNHLLADTSMDVVLYVVFEQGDTWMVFQVPASEGASGGRKSLPEAWKGLRGAALAEVTGVEDAVFCHPGLFCGGASSLEGAVKLAELAVRA